MCNQLQYPKTNSILKVLGTETNCDCSGTINFSCYNVEMIK